MIPGYGDGVDSLKGIGPEAAKKFGLLGVKNVSDLIDNFPRRYEDYSAVTPIRQLRPGAVTIEAVIKQAKGRYVRRGMHITEAIASDDTDSVRLVWFNQPYRENPDAVTDCTGQTADHAKADHREGVRQRCSAAVHREIVLDARQHDGDRIHAGAADRHQRQRHDEPPPCVARFDVGACSFVLFHASLIGHDLGLARFWLGWFTFGDRRRGCRAPPDASFNIRVDLPSPRRRPGSMAMDAARSIDRQRPRPAPG